MNIKFNENIEDDVLTNATDIENMEIKFTEKAPVRKFNEQTGCLEYKDEELRNKVKQRKKQQSCNDTLRQRLNGLKKHLERAGLDENIGKTGNSSTGDVSEQDKDVAKIQTQHAKAYILRSRREQEY